MSFNEQVCLEIIKGCFLVLGVGLGGYAASKALERYKRDQELRAEVTKRQYTAVLELFESLMKFERAITGRAFELRKDRRGQGPDPEVERWMGEQLNQGEWVAAAQGLLLGPEITGDAIRFVHQVYRVALKLLAWDMDLSAENAELNALRLRLASYVPNLKKLRKHSRPGHLEEGAAQPR